MKTTKRYREYTPGEKEFFSRIAIMAKTGDVRTAAEIYKALVNVILSDILAGRATKLPSFGSFFTKVRKGHLGHDINSGKLVMHRPKYLVLRFEPHVWMKKWLKAKESSLIYTKSE
jgi:nucleoid DNA-binding protein